MNKIYQLSLSLLPGVGGITAKKLVSYCGGVEAVFKEKKSALLKIPGIGRSLASSIVNHKVFEQAEKELEFIEKNNITTYFYLDKEYPYRLKQCIDSPVLFFMKGNADLNMSKVVSIVGTRSATDYGKAKVKEIVEGLAKYEILIVSGLAYGIDAAAHKMSLSKNIPTVGVLGHGLDMIYPPLHTKLAKQMIENGGLISDFFSGSKPDRENFPKRNRIIAGLSDAVIVAEAADRGGALITAHIANSYNRDVFAIPGRTVDPLSAGCNHIIKTHKAHMAESIQDIEYIMRWDIENSSKKPLQRQLFVELDDDEQKIIDILKANENPEIDFIVSESGFSPSKTSALLLNLEFKGLVKPLPGKIFKVVG
ncbi:MAG: DNA-processing protein DprA [Bacteroidetes bacterium]|nr:DNA-processing protein DprA [Bacteroidota bacterium]